MNAHVVQFCSDDRSVVDATAQLVVCSRNAGESVLVIAAAANLQELSSRVHGGLPAGADSEGALLTADAEEVLAQILVSGIPDPDRFDAVVGGLVAQVRGASPRRVRLVSELGAMLGGIGDAKSVQVLEQIWCGFAKQHALQLHCLYSMHRLGAAWSPDAVEALCRVHSLVVPCGLSIKAAADPHSLRRTIAGLQQRVALLEAELATYRNAGEVAEKARRDMAVLAQAYSELERVANLDPLTGLYNRRVFLDRLEHALERARRRRNSFALLLVDLDDFKSVNDRHGHEAGDRVLREVATRLSLCARGSDTVCRLGGDEFTVIMEDCSLTEATLVAQRIVEMVDKEIAIGGERVQPSASVGVSVYPDHAADAAALIRSADQAMYRAKGYGKGRYEDSGSVPLQ